MTTSTDTTPQATAWGVGVTDRDDLTMMLVSAAQERPGAFLAALRGCTRDLDTDAQDDAFLGWLAGGGWTLTTKTDREYLFDADGHLELVNRDSCRRCRRQSSHMRRWPRQALRWWR